MLGFNSIPPTFHGGLVACSKLVLSTHKSYEHLVPHRYEVNKNMMAYYKNPCYGHFMAVSSVILNENGTRSETELHT